MATAVAMSTETFTHLSSLEDDEAKLLSNQLEQLTVSGKSLPRNSDYVKSVNRKSNTQLDEHTVRDDSSAKVENKPQSRNDNEVPSDEVSTKISVQSKVLEATCVESSHDTTRAIVEESKSTEHVTHDEHSAISKPCDELDDRADSGQLVARGPMRGMPTHHTTEFHQAEYNQTAPSADYLQRVPQMDTPCRGMPCESDDFSDIYEVLQDSRMEQGQTHRPPKRMADERESQPLKFMLPNQPDHLTLFPPQISTSAQSGNQVTMSRLLTGGSFVTRNDDVAREQMAPIDNLSIDLPVGVQLPDSLIELNTDLLYQFLTSEDWNTIDTVIKHCDDGQLVAEQLSATDQSLTHLEDLNPKSPLYDPLSALEDIFPCERAGPKSIANYSPDNPNFVYSKILPPVNHPGLEQSSSRNGLPKQPSFDIAESLSRSPDSGCPDEPESVSQQGSKLSPQILPSNAPRMWHQSQSIDSVLPEEFVENSYPIEQMLNYNPNEYPTTDSQQKFIELLGSDPVGFKDQFPNDLFSNEYWTMMDGFNMDPNLMVDVNPFTTSACGQYPQRSQGPYSGPHDLYNVNDPYQRVSGWTVSPSPTASLTLGGQFIPGQAQGRDMEWQGERTQERSRQKPGIVDRRTGSGQSTRGASKGLVKLRPKVAHSAPEYPMPCQSSPMSSNPISPGSSVRTPSPTDEEPEYCTFEDCRRFASLSKEKLLSVDDDGDLYLHIAIAKREKGLVQAYLYRCDREGITPDVINCSNKIDQTPLTLAIVMNLAEVVQMLVRRGVDVNKQCHMRTATGPVHYRPLHKVVDKGVQWLPLLVQLLRAPALDLDAFDSEGRTPLMRAIEAEGIMPADGISVIDSKLVILQLLLSGADLTKQNSSNDKPVIHYVVEKKNYEFLLWFLNVVQNSTAPHSARRPGPPRPSLRDIVNARTNQNVSALQLAAAGDMTPNQVQIVKLLLDAGAELLKNGDNDIKRRLKNEKIAPLLKGAGMGGPRASGSRRNSSRITTSSDA